MRARLLPENLGTIVSVKDFAQVGGVEPGMGGW